MFTCENPLWARFWFKLRGVINWATVIIGLILIVFILQEFMPYWVADVIAITLMFCLYFFVLNKWAIDIRCPSCFRILKSNTPWICGYKFCRNENVDNFPFISRCQHCGTEPKSYKCHHSECGQLIFFTNDRQKTNYATFISSSSNLPPPPSKPKEPGKWEKKVAQESEELHNLQHELKKTQLQGDIHDEKRRIQPLKSERELIEEDLDKMYDRNIGAEEAARKKKAMVDIQFANDPESRARRHAMIEAWMRERI